MHPTRDSCRFHTTCWPIQLPPGVVTSPATWTPKPESFNKTWSPLQLIPGVATSPATCTLTPWKLPQDMVTTPTSSRYCDNFCSLHHDFLQLPQDMIAIHNSSKCCIKSCHLNFAPESFHMTGSSPKLPSGVATSPANWTPISESFPKTWSPPQLLPHVATSPAKCTPTLETLNESLKKDQVTTPTSSVYCNKSCHLHHDPWRLPQDLGHHLNFPPPLLSSSCWGLQLLCTSNPSLKSSTPPNKKTLKWQISQYVKKDVKKQL